MAKPHTSRGAPTGARRHASGLSRYRGAPCMAMAPARSSALWVPGRCLCSGGCASPCAASAGTCGSTMHEQMHERISAMRALECRRGVYRTAAACKQVQHGCIILPPPSPVHAAAAAAALTDVQFHLALPAACAGGIDSLLHPNFQLDPSSNVTVYLCALICVRRLLETLRLRQLCWSAALIKSAGFRARDLASRLLRHG